MKKKEKIPPSVAFNFCIRWAKKFPFLIFFIILPIIATPISENLLPYLIKKIVDMTNIFEGEKLKQEIFIYTFLYISGLILWELCWRIHGYFVDVKFLPIFRSTLINFSIDEFLKKDHSFFQKSMSGDLSKKVFDIGEGPLELILLIFNRFPMKIVMVISSIIFLFFTRIEFSIIIVFWSIFVFLSFYLIIPRVIRKSEEFSKTESSLSGEIVDLFTNSLSIRLFANKNLEIKKLNYSTKNYIQKERKMEIENLILFSFSSISFILLQGFSLYFLINLKSKNLITSGDFAFVLGVNANIVDSMWYLMFEIMDFTKYLGKTQQALSDIYEKINIVDQDDCKDIQIKNAEIEFKNVNFFYKKTNKLIFENFNCKINPGEKVGLVGSSGCGKTTFINLLTRIYDIDKGEILIDNQNISKIKIDSLRRNLSIVSQDPSLFCRSVYENIKYGDFEKNNSQVIEASKKAFCDNFVQNLEKGYQTILGEKGSSISGGQRQRIAIARAFLKDSPIIILDEATSALDTLNEKEIQKSLWNLMKDKTCIIIAHRLSTLIDMDRILVFENGKIIEDGNHKDLLAKKKSYYDLWVAQTEKI